MNRVVAILILSGILLQTFSKLVIYTNYQINKEYITKLFCENKSKPKMHCNGKCHMMKQLKEQDKKESTPANNLKEKFEIQLFSERNTRSELLIPHASFLFSDYLLHKETTPYLLSVFHPPTC